MAGKPKISKKKIILIVLACLITVLIIGMSVMVARGEIYVHTYNEGDLVEFFSVTTKEDPDKTSTPEKLKFNVDTTSSNKQYYSILDSYKDKNMAVTATVGPTYLNNSSRSLYDGVLHFDQSRLMLGTIFKTSGRQSYTSLFVKEDGGTPESIYMASIEFAKIPGASSSDVAKNLYLINEGEWVNSYTKQETKSNATHQIFIFRYANGDLGTSSGRDTRVGWDGKNCEGTHVDLADYKYKYIIFNPFKYIITAGKGFTDTGDKSVFINRWGLENVYDQIADRESKVGEDFIGWSVKNNSSKEYVFGTTATTGLKVADMKKYLDGSCFQAAAFANLSFTALYKTPGNAGAGGSGSGGEEPSTDAEAPTKTYKVITNYFYFRNNGGWDLVTSDPVYLNDQDYYEIPAPHVDGYGDPQVGYYNPHNTSEFIETPGETICDWMVNNGCITFSVIYQQPFLVTAKHFTWIGGELIYQDEWDNVRLVGKGSTYEVDMTSRGPYDVIKAGEFSGDLSNPVTEEQYAFTVNENMTVALVYQKVNADYKVKHYQQNTEDDHYTLVATDEKMGNVGAEPEYGYKTFTGFTKNEGKADIPYEIAEDDSTVVKLYYDRNTHTVTLNKGTGISSVTGAGTYRYGQTVNISASVGAGYDFVNWKGTGGVLPSETAVSSSFVMPDKNVGFTAKTSPKSFTVSFRGNGGTASVSDMTVTYDSTNGNSNAVTVSRDYYVLGGWYTEWSDTGAGPSGEMVFDKDGNAAGGTYWNGNGSSAVWKGLSDVTVYAYWDYCKYNLYFNYNVPSDADADTLNGAGTKQKKVTYTKPYGDLPSPGLAGYSFDGWYTKKTDGSPVTEDTLHETPADSTVFAHWSLTRYNITYDYNGGLCENSNPDSALYTESVTIYAPYRNGYDFAGWNITDMDETPHMLDGKTSYATSAENIASGKSSAIFSKLRGDNGTVKFTAVWKARPYNITYNLDGGTDPGNPTGYTCETEDFTLKNPSKTGYIFTGWTGTDLFGTVKDVRVSKGSHGNREYTAHYDKIRYNMSYVLNGGSFGADYPTEALYDTAFNISNPSRGNAYTFAGWDITGMDNCTHTIGTSSSTDASATGIKATSFKNLRNTEGCVTFTARWTAVPYNITYNLNGAADPGNPYVYTADTESFTLMNPSKTGYIFTGWTGTGLDTNNHSVFIPQGSTGNRKYTATFSPNSYRIEYVLNGGTAGTDAPDEAEYDSAINISNPTKPGAVFVGWDIAGMDNCKHTVGLSTSTASTAAGIKGTSFKNLRSTFGTVTFTAVWQYSSYSITYDFNGGHGADGGSYPASADTWTAFNVTPPVHDNEYTFLGWTIMGMDNGEHYYGGNTSNDSTLEGIKSTEFKNLRYSSGKVRFTAAWERPVRQVIFMSDGGEMKGASIQDSWTMRFLKFGDTGFSSKTEYGISWGKDVPKVYKDSEYRNGIRKQGYTFLGYYDSSGNMAFDGAYKKTMAGLVPGTGTVPGQAVYYWDASGKWIGPSLILYAHYKPNSYKVYYNLNGGAWADTDSYEERNVTVTYDSTDYNRHYGEEDLYRRGYTFDGWYDAVTGGEKVYDADGRCTEGSYWSTDYVE